MLLMSSLENTMTQVKTNPEDIGLKVGTKEEQAWTLIRDKCQEEILGCKRTIEMDEVLIELAKEKILKEK